jgi:hypothetical protein
MAQIKYKVDGTSMPAFMPVPAGASAKATTYGSVHVTGNPGNRSIPSPKPQAIPPGPLPRSAQPSYNSPDTFNPSLYYTTITDMHPGNNTIRVTSTNEVPVPAVPSNRVPGVAYRSPHMPSIRQVSWPPAPQSWQSSASQGGN